MSTVITSTPGLAWVTGFMSPDGGDGRDAASHQVAHQALSDKAQFLFDRVGDGSEGLITESVTLATPLAVTQVKMGAPLLEPASWTFHTAYAGTDANLPTEFWWQGNGGGSPKHWGLYPFDLPDGATIVSLVGSVQAIGAGSFPADQINRLHVAVLRRSGTVNSLVGSIGYDASANLGAYTAVHSITAAVGAAYSQAFQYFAAFRLDSNGYGAVHSFSLAWTSADIRPGGA